jgi:hypothetical protein
LPVSTAGVESKIRYRKQRLRKPKKRRSRKRKSVNVPVGCRLNRLKVQKPASPGFFNAATTGNDVHLQVKITNCSFSGTIKKLIRSAIQ